MEGNESIGAKIVALRKTKGVTQADLGAYLNISSQAVSKWERGESCPDFLTMTRLAEYFGVSLNYFAGTEEKTETGNTDKAETPVESKKGQVCPFCGKISISENGFCEHCDGYYGKKTEEVKTGAQTKMKTSTALKNLVKCGACGKIIRKGTVYCPNCHTMLGTGNMQAWKQESANVGKTNGWAIAGLVCSLLVSWVLGIIFGILGWVKAEKTGVGKGMSIASIIISIVMMIISIAMIPVISDLMATLATLG